MRSRLVIMDFYLPCLICAELALLVALLVAMLHRCQWPYKASSGCVRLAGEEYTSRQRLREVKTYG
jgi:hypothetical protein